MPNFLRNRRQNNENSVRLRLHKEIQYFHISTWEHRGHTPIKQQEDEKALGHLSEKRQSHAN